MKSIAPIALGLVSSLCLAAGLNRIAELSDPLSGAASSPKGGKLTATCMDCATQPCFMPEPAGS